MEGELSHGGAGTWMLHGPRCLSARPGWLCQQLRTSPRQVWMLLSHEFLFSPYCRALPGLQWEPRGWAAGREEAPRGLCPRPTPVLPATSEPGRTGTHVSCGSRAAPKPGENPSQRAFLLASLTSWDRKPAGARDLLQSHSVFWSLRPLLPHKAAASEHGEGDGVR